MIIFFTCFSEQYNELIFYNEIGTILKLLPSD